MPRKCIKYGRAGGPGHALIYAHVVGMCALAVGFIFFRGGKIGGRPKSYAFTSRVLSNDQIKNFRISLFVNALMFRASLAGVELSLTAAAIL